MYLDNFTSHREQNKTYNLFTCSVIRVIEVSLLLDFVD